MPARHLARSERGRDRGRAWPHGAGKTTTVRSLMGLTPMRQGKIEIFGKDTTHWPEHRIAGLGVGYVPEGRKIFGNLTVLANLKVPQARRGSWDIERVLKLFPRLAERKSQLGRQLSGGEQEMLSIVRSATAQSEHHASRRAEPGAGAPDRARGEGGAAHARDDGKAVHTAKAADLAKDTELVNKLAGAGKSAA